MTIKHYFSKACSIELEDLVVVTGGIASGVIRTRVPVYSTSGAGEKLPDMNTARYNHACGHYMKDDKVVTIWRYLTTSIYL